MPELPEVETTRRGIEPHINHQTINDVVVRNHALRWPIPKQLRQKIRKQQIQSVDRRGKYLLLGLETGTVIIHLGMSGSLRICTANTVVEKHDHVDFIFGNNKILRSSNCCLHSAPSRLKTISMAVICSNKHANAAHRSSH
jgi:formamidopyrimidine-DNA glycosylase